jgi:hypothetical protein
MNIDLSFPNHDTLNNCADKLLERIAGSIFQLRRFETGDVDQLPKCSDVRIVASQT